MNKIQQYDFFEAKLNLSIFPGENPFDKNVNGTFTSPENKSFTVAGFYDGTSDKEKTSGTCDVFKIRFMPQTCGLWKYELCDGQTGTFEVIGAEPCGNNHGPVRVSQKYHFAYADGTRYIPNGTTCYVWHLQTPELIEETFKTLEKSSFNKIRFCIFPKHYDYNFRDPLYFPFEGRPIDNSKISKWNFQEYNCKSPGNEWDFSRFNTEYFRHLENCILRLQKMGIEADLILFHPYDRWGFQNMKQEINIRYLKYVTARLSAFRNVWWSLANEYDFNPYRNVAEWEELAQVLVENDPYNHLRSIHNGTVFYDFSKKWISHCSIQRVDVYKCAEYTNEWREKYGKPVILDEISYEGNIQWGWGNSTGQEIVRRCWEAALRGGYGSHSETFVNKNDVLWWSHGGKLYGQSEARLAFLLKIMEDAPGNLKYAQSSWDDVHALPENDEIAAKIGYQLFYYSFMQPSFRDFDFGNTGEKFKVEIIDTWEMTVKEAGLFSGKTRIDLPGKQFIAVRVRKEKSPQ